MKKINLVLKYEINSLAALFYKLQGYEYNDHFDFSRSNHPQEQLMFEMAKLSHEFWTNRFKDRKKANNENN